MPKVIQIILTLMFGGSSLFAAAEGILFCVGLMFLFKKSGLSPRYAWIPGYRHYSLARCADCEAQGRFLFFGEIVLYLLSAAYHLFDYNETVSLLLAIVNFVLTMAVALYSIQIYLSLIEIFQVRRLWVLPWLFFSSLTAFLWGILKHFQPTWQVADIEEEKQSLISGKKAIVMENGLTVNLEERSVLSFFRRKYLLRDVHMYIQPGHMVLLLGGSGAGKTTLLNAMIGYEKANAEMILNGSNIYHEYKKMQYEIGFVPQLDLMRGNDTVFNTLMDAAALRLPGSFTTGERRQRVEEVMKIFGLTPVKSSLVDKLSGGQRKRLSIAMEFIPNPSLFILDEPDSGLDGIMARELMQQLRMIADQGKIILVITHTPDRVIDLFDDVIVLAKDANRTGRLAFFGPIQQARDFFETDRMEGIVQKINRKEEGGTGQADEFIAKYTEVQNG